MKNLILMIILSISCYGAGIDFVDSNFENFLLTSKWREAGQYIWHDYDENQDGMIDKYEASLPEIMNCSNQNISNLSGIEYFANLTWLDASSNSLTVFDPHVLPMLSILDLKVNNLEKLDCSYMQYLTSLSVSYNNLYDLNLKGCYNIIGLGLEYNRLAKIYFFKDVPNLQLINVANNDLTYINLFSFYEPWTVELICDHNFLTYTSCRTLENFGSDSADNYVQGRVYTVECLKSGGTR